MKCRKIILIVGEKLWFKQIMKIIFLYKKSICGKYILQYLFHYGASYYVAISFWAAIANPYICFGRFSWHTL